LREKVFRGFVMRGDNGGPHDNKAIIAEMVRLRAQRAELLGYADFAHYRLDDAMAKTPAAVRDLLDKVWRPGPATPPADPHLQPATPARRGPGRTGQIPRSSRGTGATMSKSCAGASAISTKPPSSRISASSA